MAEKPKTIVLLSGGMNSAAMLYDIVTFEKAEVLDCMIFDSYQPSEDVACARGLCERLGISFSLWNLEPAPIISSCGWDSPEVITKEFSADLRNTCFLQMLVAAVRYAKLAGAESVTAGFCYKDVEFDLLEFADTAALLWNLETTFNFPMWDLEKWEIFKLAEDLNRVVEVLGSSHSCLIHDRDVQHPWGYGCGSCDGCVRRWRAWEEHLERKKGEG
jgi:7-cyano-7-deazaguanine synthase in queuosine biosynthesis